MPKLFALQGKIMYNKKNQRNPKHSKEIQNIPKKSKTFQRNPKKIGEMMQ